ncbi:MAG: hypothetical protein R3F11_18610 [Verrucomicrobiales bacterium]
MPSRAPGLTAAARTAAPSVKPNETAPGNRFAQLASRLSSWQ